MFKQNWHKARLQLFSPRICRAPHIGEYVNFFWRKKHWLCLTGSLSPPFPSFPSHSHISFKMRLSLIFLVVLATSVLITSLAAWGITYGTSYSLAGPILSGPPSFFGVQHINVFRTLKSEQRKFSIIFWICKSCLFSSKKCLEISGKKPKRNEMMMKSLNTTTK